MKARAEQVGRCTEVHLAKTEREAANVIYRYIRTPNASVDDLLELMNAFNRREK